MLVPHRETILSSTRGECDTDAKMEMINAISTGMKMLSEACGDVFFGGGGGASEGVVGGTN